MHIHVYIESEKLEKGELRPGNGTKGKGVTRQTCGKKKEDDREKVYI